MKEKDGVLTIRFRRTRASLASIQRNMSTSLNRSSMRSGVNAVELWWWSWLPCRPAADWHWPMLDATAAVIWHRNRTSITSKHSTQSVSPSSYCFHVCVSARVSVCPVQSSTMCVRREMYSTRVWKVDNISLRTKYCWKRRFIGFLMI